MLKEFQQQLHSFQSDNIPIPHGTLTSVKGYSQGLFASLNIGLNVEDDQDIVFKNREKIKSIFHIKFLVSGNQTHSDHIFIVDKAQKNDLIIADTDAFITNIPHIGLMVQHADCQAVLIHDPQKKAIAAIHSGWKGSVQNIIGKTVKNMQQAYGSDPTQMTVYISPSLGPCCAEFKNYQQELPPEFLPWKTEQHYFDFWAISCKQLTDCGVRSKNITVASICTVCDNRFFSHRRAVKNGQNGKTGRNGTFIMLNASTSEGVIS